ncbi:D3-type cyclin isoform 1 [Tripterygium wilfordii]|uniref:B-like cyclin n=1 Tax=Tripterygium wilfordii TaxID=458696 RepID=A0A7J7D2S9_TRIWF|nr:cyclin-D3-3-like [Tripterygium wilfordii]KAF5740647.1 D3-type cyclin isoform 1 [Tripterygium wilfordii]
MALHSLQNDSFYDALYCSEKNWEEEVGDDNFLQQESYDVNDGNKSCESIPILVEQDLSWEDEELSSLLGKQVENDLYKTMETNQSLAWARREAVDWILKVNAHYNFSALTGVLAVNYFDRFLFSFEFQREKPWMAQLAAVACLSLAAKVEEIQVPLLLDLQVEESRYVFDAKTIKRMEILVLSTLDWKMNPVTPISFFDYIARRLEFKDHLCWEFLRRCECILLSVISDSRFTHYRPSVMAPAVMLHVIDTVKPCLRAEYQDQILGILGIENDKVDECCKLVMEFASGIQSNKRKLGTIPGSPDRVIDVSFSSDNSNDSRAEASSVSSSPEPLSKKSRAVQS